VIALEKSSNAMTSCALLHIGLAGMEVHKCPSQFLSRL
jgi:hypothetical protein